MREREHRQLLGTRFCRGCLETHSPEAWAYYHAERGEPVRDDAVNGPGEQPIIGPWYWT